MAITKILHMKQSGTRCKYLHLKNAITYILNPEKTKHGALVGGGNCVPRHALKGMLDTKAYYGKEEGRQGYHIIISCAPWEGEATPELAFEVMGKFAERYLGKDWEYIYTAHDDKEHAHAHLIFNSVCLTDGHKYHYKKGDWERYIQPIVNDLCREYDLSEIRFEEAREPGRNMKYNQWQAVNEGRMDWREIMRGDINELLKETKDPEAILERLKEEGYDVKYNEDGKLLLRPYGKKGFVSARVLGEKYDKLFNEKLPLSDEDVVLNPKNADEKEWDAGDFRCELPTLYVYRRAVRLKHHTFKGDQSWRYKKDILRLHELQAQCQYLVTHDIHSLAELDARYDHLLSEGEKLKAVRQHIRKYEKDAPDLAERLERISEMQRELWKEKRLAEKIRQESLKDMEEMKALKAQKEKEQEKEAEKEKEEKRTNGQRSRGLS